MCRYLLALRLFLLILLGAPYGLLAEEQLASSLSHRLLNSERIANRYGNYGIEVVFQSSDHRISNLYSTDDGTRITRTLAVVIFLQPVSPSIAALHKSVLSGQSLGATFKNNGWHVSKVNLDIETLVVGNDGGKIQGLMGLADEHELALHTYLVRLSRGDPLEGEVRQASESIDYAVIAELHHPDYLDVEAVKAIHGETMDVSESGQSFTEPMRRVLLEFIAR